MNNRVFNFSSGPAMLPEEILQEAQDELLNWKQKGLSILELGHRSPEFIDLLEHAEQSLRTLLAIPDHYRVLFMGGAARTQFAAIPMNLLSPQEQAAYLVTGIWSKMALEEAQNLKKAYCLASEEEGGFKTIPRPGKWNLKQDTAYVYYTPNETVNGLRFSYVPEAEGLPLIADMTSCLLSEPLDINNYALIFAGAQKNIANAGLTLVIIREDLLSKQTQSSIPKILDYKTQALNRSLYATLPVFNCYLADKMFSWIQKQGGVNLLYQHNCAKAAKLYDFLDATAPFYLNEVAKEARSLVNVCFSLSRPELEADFIRLAEERGLYGLKGHRFVGGIRASLYNAMPMKGVDALIAFMTEFKKEFSL